MSIRNWCWTGRNDIAVVLIWVLFVSAGAAESAVIAPSPDGAGGRLSQTPAAPITATAPASPYKERLLEVDINRQELCQTVLVLEDQAGTLYLSSEDLRRWRFRPPLASAAIDYLGNRYFPLSAIADVSHKYDPQALTLLIEVRPEAFAKTTRNTQYDNRSPPVKPSPGGFFNYDLFASRGADSTQRSGLFEAGYFNRYGVGTSTVLADQLGANMRTTRLTTTWTVDYPEKLQTLRVGDAVNAAGTWGRSLNFGGIQFGSNFGTQPGFITFTPQTAAGQAVLPSTVDIFVNNAMVSRQNVPPGPFSIANLPIVSGAGEVRLVVRDMLGREQVIVQPFYSSQALLRKGLESFSYEFGFVRENLGINSNDYGSWLGTGTYRRGVSERFTGEIHAEAMRNQTTAGAGGDYLIPRIGTLSAYVAGSQAESNRGALALLGIDRQAWPWSFGARTQWTTAAFTQVGLPAPQLAPVQQSTFNLSYAAGAAGSIGVAYIKQHNRDQDDTRIATLSYSVSLGKLGAFTISALRSLEGIASTTVFAALSIPLGTATTASVSAQSTHGGGVADSRDMTTTLQRNVPSGEGYGYRLQARSDGAKEGNITLQNNVGTYSLGVAQANGSTTTSVGVSGGVVVAGSDMFMSRRVDQSFAVVRIPDYPNVRILADNQPAGRTDANGNALIPRLRAYDRNMITIDQRDLPLDAEIKSLRVGAVPYFRSGVDVTFPIKHSRGATFTVQLEDGTPLPVGASVQEVGTDATFTAGYAGEVYVTGLGPTTRLRASWSDQSCEFDVRYTRGKDPLPDLGTFICTGVAP
jgi:outer membrane usher protein